MTLDNGVRSIARQSRALSRPETPGVSPLSELFAYAPPIVALPMVGLGIAGAIGSGPTFLRRHPVASALLACGGLAILAKSQFDRFLLEQPDYELEEEIDGLEIRRYAPRNVAETTVEAASFDDARKEAFQRLADYLFGNNVPEEKLSMTVPVSVMARGLERGERLAMTTPVTLGRSPAGYVMRFAMPKARALNALPQPNDPRVSLRRLPGERVAALRFRGSYAGEHIAEKERELLDRVAAAGLMAAGEPAFAGYDSPAALPLLRRVEVWVPLA
jgi:hypothetical protein